MNIGNIVECISTEGFDIDLESFILEDGIGIGDVLTISKISPDYSHTGLEGLNFEGKEYTHPSTSFKIKE